MVVEKYNPKWIEQFRTLKEFLEKNATEYNKIKAEILSKVGTDNRAGYVQMKEEEYKWFFEKVLS